MKYIGQHIFDYVASFRQNVGIGTDTPNRQLQVKKTTGTASIAITSSNTGTAQLELGGTSDNDIAGISYNSNTQKLFLKTNNTGQLYIDNSGNVSVGTDTPAAQFHVNPSGTIGWGNLGNAGILVGSNVGSAIGIDGNEIVSKGDNLYIGTATADKDLIFRTGGANNRLVIDGSTGDVTISSNLTVSGTTTTINTANLNVEDKNITLNYSTGDSSSTADGAGITIQDAVDSSNDATLLWNATQDRFNFSHAVQLPDSTLLYLGSDSDMNVQHTGSDGFIMNDTGDLYIRNRTDDGDIVFQTDNGSGGVTTYFKLQGGAEQTVFNKKVKFEDSVELRFGNGNDMRLHHNGSNNSIESYSGNLRLIQYADDSDIQFMCDDGSGGVETYLTIDGSARTVNFGRHAFFPDGFEARFGDAYDLTMKHNGTNSSIINNVGDLQIINNTDDGDILFKCDDGSGGTTDYVRIDGNNQFIRFDKNTYHPTGKRITIGSSQEGRIFYESSTLKITQTEDDADISFQCDDGSGGVTEYFRLDGSSETVEVAKATNFASTVTASSYKISAATVLSGSTNVTLGSAGATGTISLTTHGGTPFRIDDNDRIIITRDGGHTSGNISASQSTVDIFNPHTNDTDEKGSILTFSDNYFDSGGAQKTIRAAIKGGTDTTGNTGDGFLAFYTDSSTANSATERARINKDGNFSVHSTQQSYATGTSFTGAVDGLTGSINTLGGISVKRHGFFGGFVMFKGMTQSSRGIEVRPPTTGNGTAFFPVMIGRNNDTGNANYLLVGGPGGNEWAFGLYDGSQSGGTPVDQSHMIRFKAGAVSDLQPRIFVGDSGSNTTNTYIEVAGHKVGTTKAVVLLHGSDGVVGNSGSNGSDSHTWTITHGMGSSRNYKVEIIQNSGNYDTVHADITRPSDTTIVVTFGAAVANSAYKALILKCG